MAKSAARIRWHNRLKTGPKNSMKDAEFQECRYLWLMNV